MKNLKKLLALTLALVMSLALGATAFAYDSGADASYVSIVCNGKETYAASYQSSGTADIADLRYDTLTALYVNDESLPLNVLNDTLQTAQTRYVNGYNSTDGVYRIYTETYNNSKLVRLYWSGLRTALRVNASTGNRDTDYSSAYVRIVCDGKESYSVAKRESGEANIVDLRYDTLSALSVNGAKISLDVLNDTYQNAETRYVNGKNSVDGVYWLYTETLNNSRMVVIKWSGLTTTLDVRASTVAPDVYRVTASADPARYIDISGSKAVDVAAGAKWSATFTPNTVSQEIRVIRVTADNDKIDIDVPVRGGADASVGRQTLHIDRNSDGSVTVTMNNVLTDVDIVALGYNVNVDRYRLNVTTPKYISSNLTTNYFNRYDEVEVVLTPNKGNAVGVIRITDGTKVGTILTTQNSIRLNNKTYSVNRLTDGRVVLYIPGMTADVEVEVNVLSDAYIVDVRGDKYVSSNRPGVNEVIYGDSFTVTFHSAKSTYYTGIAVTTAKGTYTASWDAKSITVDGYKYRMWQDLDGNMTVQFDPVRSDMVIEPISGESRPGYNKVVATCDKYIVTNDYDSWVANGEDTSVTFALADGAKLDTIQQIRVTYGGKKYYANPANDEVIVVGNREWKLERDEDGCVTVFLTSISGDVEVYASVDEKGSEVGSGHNENQDFKIEITKDSHSEVKHDGKLPLNPGDSVTIRAYTDNGYILKSVTFTMSGKTATVVPFDESFVLNGETYAVNWVSNGDMSVTFPTLTSNLNVRVVSTTGARKGPNDVDQNETQEPPTAIDPDTNNNGYHMAYMFGYEDGRFMPNRIMTRAEALAVLSRLNAGLTDESSKTYATGSSFIDVKTSDWFAGYVGYAAQKGYLGNWIGSAEKYFNPNQGITRAEFVVLLCNFTNQNLVGVSNAQVFPDVPSSYWAYNFINYCAARGWALGYDDHEFHPDECLTRAQICALLNRINGRSATIGSGVMSIQFPDVEMSAWYFNDVMEASNSHYVTGTGNSGAELWVA